MLEAASLDAARSAPPRRTLRTTGMSDREGARDGTPGAAAGTVRTTGANGSGNAVELDAAATLDGARVGRGAG